MSSTIYLYTQKKLQEAIERCKWTDQVGVLFSQNIMPQIYEAINSMQNTGYEVDDFLKKVEIELNDN